MIHFFPTYQLGTELTPFQKALRSKGINFQFFPKDVGRRYKNRAELVFKVWPKILAAAISAGRESLKSTSAPVVMVADTHFQLGVFWLMAFLFRRSQVKLVLMGFIYNRRLGFVERIRSIYAKHVLSRADLIVCHSNLEVTTYPDYFGIAKERFCFIPWASTVNVRQENVVSPSTSKYLFSAGRSWRDYPTLIEAVRGLGVELRIACDSLDALPDLDYPSNVTILRNCYEASYHQHLCHAEAVVLPLQASMVSAGQMVLIDAYAYSKPVICTATPTTLDYVIPNETGYLVPMGDSTAWRDLIVQLLKDEEQLKVLSLRAKEIYQQRFTDESKVDYLLAELKKRGIEI